MVLLDISSKWVGGSGVGQRRNRDLARSCLDQLCTNLVKRGLSLKGVIVHHDRDSVDYQPRLAFEITLYRVVHEKINRAKLAYNRSIVIHPLQKADHHETAAAG
jgi:hypothetical protein